MNSSKLLIFVFVLLATACSSSTSTNNNILESPDPPVSTNNILPAIPAPPVATAQSANRIDISWAAAVSGATYYRLSRALTQNATYNETYAGANLSFDDTALDAGVTYFYKLSACGDNNVNTCSAQSVASSATTQNINNLPAIPAPPAATAQSANRIDISWAAVSGATYYRLSRALTQNATYNETYAGANLSFDDTALDAGVTYFYKLSACGDNNVNTCSAQSVASSATTQNINNLPAIPAPPAATAQSANRIDISWAVVSGATYYRLSRALAQNATYNETYAGANLSFDDTALDAGVTYFYKLSACGDNNVNTCSAQSVASSATTQNINNLPAIPAPPVATAQSANRIDISWAAVSGATYYRLSRALTQNATYNETYAGANLSFDDTALNAGVTYFYKLSACSDNNVNTCSAQSVASSATTQNINNLPVAPAPPVVTAQSANRIDISWAAVSGATYYRLSRALAQNATYNETYAGANLSFDDTALDAGVTYFYKLSACSDNNVNTCSAQSVASSATTQNINNLPVAPAPPVATAQSANRIDISWAVVSGATYYEIYRNSQDSETGRSLINSPPITMSPYQDQDDSLASETTYYYWLKACNNNGCSDFSALASATTQVTAPASPSVRYKVTFDPDWTQEKFPNCFPRGTHFSSLIGATHNDQVTFWETGQLASDGIKSVAETGGTSTFRREIQQEIDGDMKAKMIISGSGAGGTSPTSFMFDIERNYPLVTLITMVAPSPDWFVGVNSLSLLDDVGNWVSDIRIDLRVYDAGTDSGLSFASGNVATNPRVPIARLATPEDMRTNCTQMGTDFTADGVNGNGDFIGVFIFELQN